jgi:SOS-response transcriptional repressor LexA
MSVKEAERLRKVLNQLPMPPEVRSEAPITARQQQMLDTITQLTKQNQSFPTIREIGAAMGIKSPNGVMCHLRSLRKKGVIVRDSTGKHRGVRPVGSCPCCGQPTTTVREERGSR